MTTKEVQQEIRHVHDLLSLRDLLADRGVAPEELRRFRVAWTERRYVDGALAATERWSAILTIIVQTPTDAERLKKNPLGVYVHALNWSKELG